MKQFLDKASYVILFAYLVFFPFTFEKLSFKWLIMLFLIIALLLSFQIVIKKNRMNIQLPTIFTLFSLLLLFDSGKSINLIETFEIPISFWDISIFTVFLGFSSIVFLIKVLVEGELKIIKKSYTGYFIFACLSVCILMLIFYLALQYHYNIDFNTGFGLINIILQYFIIILIFTNIINTKKRLLRINWGLIISLSVTICLMIFR